MITAHHISCITRAMELYNSSISGHFHLFEQLYVLSGRKVSDWKEVVGKFTALYGERVYFGRLDLFSTRTCVLMEIGETFFLTVRPVFPLVMKNRAGL